MNMIPKAGLPSCTSHRLRLRIPARRGDDSFFNDLTQQWLREFPANDVVCNTLTGSLLVTGMPPVSDAIAEFGRWLSLPGDLWPFRSRRHGPALGANRQGRRSAGRAALSRLWIGHFGKSIGGTFSTGSFFQSMVLYLRNQGWRRNVNFSVPNKILTIGV